MWAYITFYFYANIYVCIYGKIDHKSQITTKVLFCLYLQLQFDSLYYCRKQAKHNLRRFVYHDKKRDGKWTRGFTILTYNSSDMIKEFNLLQALLRAKQNNLKNWSCWQNDTFILKNFQEFETTSFSKLCWNVHRPNEQFGIWINVERNLNIHLSLSNEEKYISWRKKNCWNQWTCI